MHMEESFGTNVVEPTRAAGHQRPGGVHSLGSSSVGMSSFLSFDFSPMSSLLLLLLLLSALRVFVSRSACRRKTVQPGKASTGESGGTAVETNEQGLCTPRP